MVNILVVLIKRAVLIVSFMLAKMATIIIILYQSSYSVIVSYS